MKLRRRKPDHQASSISVSADSIKKPEKIYRNGTHNGNRVGVKGNILIKINKQIKGKNEDKELRPEPGATLFGEEKQEVTIEAKRIQKQGRHNGQEKATISEDVRIFGKLRRSKP